MYGASSDSDVRGHQTQSTPFGQIHQLSYNGHRRVGLRKGLHRPMWQLFHLSPKPSLSHLRSLPFQVSSIENNKLSDKPKAFSRYVSTVDKIVLI